MVIFAQRKVCLESFITANLTRIPMNFVTRAKASLRNNVQIKKIFYLLKILTAKYNDSHDICLDI